MRKDNINYTYIKSVDFINNDNNIEEMSEGVNVMNNMYEYMNTYGNKNVDIGSKKQGILNYKKDENGSEFAIDAHVNDDDLLGFALQHINNIKKAEKFVEENPRFQKKREDTFYKELKKCSNKVKEVYASLFAGVVDVCIYDKLGSIIDGDEESVFIIGKKYEELISLLITKSCANYLPRACRPIISGDSGDYRVEIINKKYDSTYSYNYYNTFDTDTFENLDEDIKRLTNVYSECEGIDDSIWAETDNVGVTKDSIWKVDIRKGFYNELMVDIEMYGDTPANEMYKMIYKVIDESNEFKEVIKYYDFDSEFNFKVAMEALNKILSETED